MSAMQRPSNKPAWCPFCQDCDCKHFLGWTEDGKLYVPPSLVGHYPIPRSAQIVKTGVSARVYVRRRPRGRTESGEGKGQTSAQEEG